MDTARKDNILALWRQALREALDVSHRASAREQDRRLRGLVWLAGGLLLGAVTPAHAGLLDEPPSRPGLPMRCSALSALTMLHARFGVLAPFGG
jgi:hypothetical protein